MFILLRFLRMSREERSGEWAAIHLTIQCAPGVANGRRGSIQTCNNKQKCKAIFIIIKITEQSGKTFICYSNLSKSFQHSSCPLSFSLSKYTVQSFQKTTCEINERVNKKQASQFTHIAYYMCLLWEKSGFTGRGQNNNKILLPREILSLITHNREDKMLTTNFGIFC